MHSVARLVLPCVIGFAATGVAAQEPERRPTALTGDTNSVQVMGVVRLDSSATRLELMARQDTLTRFVCTRQPGWSIPAATCRALLTDLKDAARDEARGEYAAALSRIAAYREKLTAARGSMLPEPVFEALDARARWLATQMSIF